MRRRNPDSGSLMLLAGGGLAAWYLWNKSKSAPAAAPVGPPLSAAAAATIVSSAVTAAAAPPAAVPLAMPTPGMSIYQLSQLQQNAQNLISNAQTAAQTYGGTASPAAYAGAQSQLDAATAALASIYAANPRG